METQFIVNNEGEKIAVVLSLKDYEDLVHQQHLNLELTDDYKLMIDQMIDQEKNKQAKYKSLQEIKSRFARE